MSQRCFSTTRFATFKLPVFSISFVLLFVFSELSFSQASVLRFQYENGYPIAGATVLIGSGLNDPFVGNKLTTNGAGEVDIPAAWTTPLSVTVDSPLIVRATFSDVKPLPQIFEVRPSEGGVNYELRGETTGYVTSRDGWIDFGLVVPAIDRSKLLDFDLSSVVSPEMDAIRVIGNSIQVPSNISIPNQTENYILPITLNKPSYRSYFRQPGKYQVVALHGRFPFRRVVDQIRSGRALLDVLNEFEFKQSRLDDVVVRSVSGNQLDLDVTGDFFDATVEVRAPSFGGAFSMITAAMVKKENVSYPSDVKAIESGTSLRLKSSTKADEVYFVSLLRPAQRPKLISPAQNLEPLNAFLRAFAMAQSPLRARADMPQHAMSVAISDPRDQVNFLPLVSEPVVSSGMIHFSPPQPTPTIYPLATYLLLVESELRDAKFKLERRSRVWEMLFAGWKNYAEIPSVPLPARVPGRTYRWEVYFVGSDQNLGGALPTSWTEQVTHITRNATEI